MKIAVINFSGNVGKSTVAAEIIAPRLKAKVIAVESINTDDHADAERLRGEQFGKLAQILALEDDAVI
ncbi:hypothetical protein ABTK92_19385, partial [Acinetobacter baumannii]